MAKRKKKKATKRSKEPKKAKRKGDHAVKSRSRSSTNRKTGGKSERKKGRRKRRAGVDPEKFVLNCVPSLSQANDFTFEDALESGAVEVAAEVPDAVDLREDWWPVEEQGDTGACVGYATGYGVLRWHYVKAGKIDESQRPSARFIWMANKETDDITSFPTTFIETAGTQTKLALGVARKYGCVLDDVLPMSGELATISRSRFYTLAARLRIASYHNLGTSVDDWKAWLAFSGPILTRLNVERSWDRAAETDGVLNEYQASTARGGHAVCLVGYTEDHLIVRNSWGPEWGDRGFAYASWEYAEQAFTEAYGAVL